ncbi:MAG: hypothetical protein ACI9C1_001420 [Candidatus Aldehydirespiratoraceae bacterium]|jgi:hypothetical protein
MILLGRFVLGLFGENYSNAGCALLISLVISAGLDATTNV